MNTPLQLYKAFLDGLLEWPRASVVARRVREWSDQAAKPYRISEEFNRQMGLFTEEQRLTVAALLQEERDSAIHDVLAYLVPYRLSREGVELAVEPFGTEAYYDWVARRAGDAWPDERAV